MANFTLRREGEPRGEPHGEPREDHLWLDEQDETWRNSKGQPVCGARLTDRDYKWRRGKTVVKKAGSRCRLHGGASPSGKDHGRYKDGKYAKTLPAGIRDTYEEVQQDDHLTDLREELALIVTRIVEVTEALEDRDSAELWKDIEETFGKFQAARAAEDRDEVVARLHELEALIQEGAEQRSKWQEITDLVERKRKLVDSERQREKALQAYIPIDDFVMSMNVVDSILRRHIDDPETMREIADELKRTFDLGR